jgi:hypothetical protein
MRHASELRDEGALVRIVKTERNGRTYYRVMRAI